MLKVLLCVAGLGLFGTACSFPTEDYRTVPAESVTPATNESSGNDAGAREEAAPANREAGTAPTRDDDKKKGKPEDD